MASLNFIQLEQLITRIVHSALQTNGIVVGPSTGDADGAGVISVDGAGVISVDAADGAGVISVDGADSTGGVGDFAGNGFDAAGKKRKMSSKHEPEPKKKKPTLQVGPYSTFDDVDWNDENSVEQYISNNFPILTGANEELVPLRAPPTTAPSYASPVHDPMFAPPTTSPSPILDSIFLAPRTPSPAPSSLSYTLPPTNHQTFEENDITFDHPSFHSTPLHSPAPSSLGYTLPPTNYQSPERQIDDEVENLLDSILSTTYEDQEDGQRLLNEEDIQQLFDEQGKDGEEDVDEQGKDGEEDVSSSIADEDNPTVTMTTISRSRSISPPARPASKSQSRSKSRQRVRSRGRETSRSRNRSRGRSDLGGKARSRSKSKRLSSHRRPRSKRRSSKSRSRSSKRRNNEEGYRLHVAG